jgi:predicted RND superfamily exporter protein
MEQPSQQDRWVTRFTTGVIKWRWPVLVTSIIAVMAMAWGGQFLTMGTNYRIFFKGDNPQLVAFEKLQNIYTQNDNLLFVVEPEDGNVFTPETVDAVLQLSEEAWQIPYAIRVDAVTNFQHTRAEGDDLMVSDLAEVEAGSESALMDTMRSVAIREPLLLNRLISDEAHVTGINVTLQFPRESLQEVPEAVAYARELVKRTHESAPGVTVYLTGVAALNNAFSESAMGDMMTLIPLMFLIMAIVMIVSIRSVGGTFATLGVVMLSAAAAMGLGGWFGVALTPPSAQVPTIVMTLAIADSIHILVTMLKSMSKGMPKHDAIVESLRVNFQPIVLTSISTAIGFLSMNFSEVPPFHHLGNMAAAGVMIALGLSLTFLPAAVAILPIRVKVRAESASRSSAWIDRFADFVVNRKTRLLWASSAVVIFLAAMLPLNRLEDRFVEYFDESIAFRTDTDFATNNLTGIYQAEFSLEAGGSGDISEPEYLAKVDEFAEWYRSQPGVMHVSSFTDIMKRLNQNLHGDDEAYYRLPDSRELAAQYLLLYELSLPYGLDLNNQINVDKSATRFTVTLANMSAPEIGAITDAGQDWLHDNAPDHMFSYGAGTGVIFSKISGRNIRSMIFGSLIALILISGLLVFALGDLKMGLLSLIPNLVPAIAAFGIWGMTDGEVNIGLSIVMGMTLGIVVDDTIHFMSKYLRARRENGLSAEDAVRYAFATVGPALIATSVILAAGFGVLSMSSFAMNSGLGKLTAITILLALIADFTLLPVVLMTVAKTRPSLSFWRSRRLSPVPVRVTDNSNQAKTMKNFKNTIGLLLAIALGTATFVNATPSIADSSKTTATTPEERGLEIAIEADRRDAGFGDSQAMLTMILTNRHGEQSTRGLRNRTLEVVDDGDKTLVIFDDPRDVKGTAFLSYSHKEGSDDQWLYLPALKRVKRIASNNKSGPFVGSEFAYEDISSQEVEKYTYKYLRDETVDGVEYFVIERYPVDPKSGYTRQVGWIDQAEYRAHKIDFYDRKDSLLKTLTYHGYQQYLDQYWRPDEMRMVNHQTGKGTTLAWNDYEFQTGQTDRDFDQNALKRAR